MCAQKLARFFHQIKTDGATPALTTGLNMWQFRQDRRTIAAHIQNQVCWVKPGNTNLPIGGLRNANPEIGVPGQSIASARWASGGFLYSADNRLVHDILSIRAARVHIGKMEFRTLFAAGDENGQTSA